MNSDNFSAQAAPFPGGIWAIAMGGTRRAFLASGGTLASPSDFPAYVAWTLESQQQVFTHLYQLGVATIISVVRIPADRGAAYSAGARGAVEHLLDGPRAAWHTSGGLRVSAAGDLEAIGHALGLPSLSTRWQELRQRTANAAGPQLIYLFRGTWSDAATEEAGWGWKLGMALGRAPTRDELVAAYYGAVLPPLAVYLGSGRPQIGQLRPPFLGGQEDCYWSAAPLQLLQAEDWRAIADDHTTARRTSSGRTYPSNAQERLAAVLLAQRGHILGIGQRHPEFGFWTPQIPCATSLIAAAND